MTSSCTMEDVEFFLWYILARFALEGRLEWAWQLSAFLVPPYKCQTLCSVIAVCVTVPQNASWKQLVGKVVEPKKSPAALWHQLILTRAQPWDIDPQSALAHSFPQVDLSSLPVGGLIRADEQQLKTKHDKRYWPSTLHHPPFILKGM